MPKQNRFRHQTYPTSPQIPPSVHRLAAEASDTVDFSQLHARFGISQVVLVHGTFMGDDPFAISETLSAIGGSSPLLEKPLKSLATKLKEKIKPITDEINGDVGNYDANYRQQFQQLVGDDPIVKLMQPTWSGQNHHFARADLAVRLLCMIADCNLTEDESVLLWGHSHAGNGFAILTNLLANEPNSVAAFFEAAAQTSPHWTRARTILETASTPSPAGAQCSHRQLWSSRPLWLGRRWMSRSAACAASL